MHARRKACSCCRNAELLDLGRHGERGPLQEKSRTEQVTFVIDTNPNYTNICTIDCIFCAFYRHPGEEGEYTHTVDEMIAKFKDAAAERRHDDPPAGRRRTRRFRSSITWTW